jgi:hypothetical protein
VFLGEEMKDNNFDNATSAFIKHLGTLPEGVQEKISRDFSAVKDYEFDFSRRSRSSVSQSTGPRSLAAWRLYEKAQKFKAGGLSYKETVDILAKESDISSREVKDIIGTSEEWRQGIYDEGLSPLHQEEEIIESGYLRDPESDAEDGRTGLFQEVYSTLKEYLPVMRFEEAVTAAANDMGVRRSYVQSVAKRNVVSLLSDGNDSNLTHPGVISTAFLNSSGKRFASRSQRIYSMAKVKDQNVPVKLYRMVSGFTDGWYSEDDSKVNNKWAHLYNVYGKSFFFCFKRRADSKSQSELDMDEAEWDFVALFVHVGDGWGYRTGYSNDDFEDVFSMVDNDVSQDASYDEIAEQFGLTSTTVHSPLYFIGSSAVVPKQDSAKDKFLSSSSRVGVSWNLSIAQMLKDLPTQEEKTQALDALNRSFGSNYTWEEAIGEVPISSAVVPKQDSAKDKFLSGQTNLLEAIDELVSSGMDYEEADKLAHSWLEE